MPHEAVARTLTPADAGETLLPVKSPDQRRSHVVALRLTPSELARFARVARAMEERTPGVEVPPGVALRAAALRALPDMEAELGIVPPSNDPTPAKAKPKK